MTWHTFSGVFMFTDIVDSTALWSEDPKAMFTTVVQHNEALRTCVAAHGGRVVKYRGDGVHAVFADSADALSAAIAAQRCILTAEWPVAVKIRAALHRGYAIAHDGDVYGPAVNIAARLVDWVPPGQIAATGAVLASACAGLVRFDHVTLRGVAEPVEVAALEIDAAASRSQLRIDLDAAASNDHPEAPAHHVAPLPHRSTRTSSFGCRVNRPTELTLAA